MVTLQDATRQHQILNVMQMATIDSVQVGKVVTEGDPETRDVTTKQWTSAFRKTPVNEPVVVREMGLVGDEVADAVHHGGIDKAVLCYARRHYEDWRREFPDLDFLSGGFGENLTIGGLDEQGVCIGDLWRSGEVILEVSQPRQPCWKIARRWGVKSITKEVARTGRTGWYVRVRRAGSVAAGQRMELQDRPHPDWSVARANEVLYKRSQDPGEAAELAALPALAEAWKEALR